MKRTFSTHLKYLKLALYVQKEPQIGREPIISPADPPVLSTQVKRTEKAAVNRIKPPVRTRRH